MKKINKLKEIVLVLLIIILLILIFKISNIGNWMIMLLKILIPLFVGFIYAWLLNPFIEKLSKKWKRNIICIIIFMFIVIIILLLLYFLIPIIYREINELIDILPNIMEIVRKKVSNLIEFNKYDYMFNNMVERLPNIIVIAISNVFKYIGMIGIGLVLGLYVSMDYLEIVDFIYSRVPTKYNNEFINVTKIISREVRKCIYGTFLVACLVFVLDTIIFFFLKVDAALLLGLMCGLTDLIPYVGPYIGGTLAVLVALTDSTKIGIFTLIGCVIVQLLENCVFQPIVMSKSIRISPIFIIISMLIFSKMLGLVGMLIATPVVAVLKVLANYISEKKILKKS